MEVRVQRLRGLWAKGDEAVLVQAAQVVAALLRVVDFERGAGRVPVLRDLLRRRLAPFRMVLGCSNAANGASGGKGLCRKRGKVWGTWRRLTGVSKAREEAVAQEEHPPRRQGQLGRLETAAAPLAAHQLYRAKIKKARENAEWSGARACRR